MIKKDAITIVFAGTDQFAVSFLRALLEPTHCFNIIGVITQPDRPAGRNYTPTPPPVKEEALRHAVRVYQPSTKQALNEVVHELHPDLVIVVAYGRLIPEDLLQSVPYGWLNVHPSLLPHHRGPSPVESVILAGEHETGISFMILDKGMDHGPILMQHALAVHAQETAEQLFIRLGDEGSRLLPTVIQQYLNHNLQPHEQDHTRATYTKLLTREDGEVKPTQETAQQIDRKVHAFHPWPGAYCVLPNGERLKIISGAVANVSSQHKNILECDQGHCYLLCAENTVYELLVVQRAGKQIISARAFCAGYKE